MTAIDTSPEAVEREAASFESTYGKPHPTADLLRALSGELARAREWHPMSSAPMDGTTVLLAIHDCGDPTLPFHYAVAYFNDEDGQWHRSEEEYDTTWPPVYWQPVLALPSQGPSHG